MSLRVGIGVDAHAFEDGVPLVLAGVAFESPRGLAGHSDGDVITHALIDAILGAAGLGDIGSLFPSDRSTPKGISSLELLRDAVERVDLASVHFGEPLYRDIHAAPIPFCEDRALSKPRL